ncbi:MAG: diguanylate cyclase [Ardenticatenaceae bacterium]|nr:diguanylate cyclase [Ardenticatenaceae bacterium]
MNKLFTSTRIIVVFALVMFEVVALLGIWRQPAETQILMLTLFIMVVVSALAYPNRILSAVTFGAAVAMYGLVVSVSEARVGVPIEIARGGLLLAIATLAAWGLSRHLEAVEQAFIRQTTLIEELSVYDPETGAIRASHFYPFINQEVDRARRYRLPFSIAIVQLVAEEDALLGSDQRSGHELNRNLTRLILATVRTVDRVGQGSGGEWLLLLPNTDRSGAQTLANRLVRLAADQQGVTITVGVATFPDDGADSQTLLDEAEAAQDFARMNAIPVVSRALLDA